MSPAVEHQSINAMAGDKDRVAGGLRELLDPGSDVDGIADQSEFQRCRSEAPRRIARRRGAESEERAHGGVSMTGKVVGCAEDGQRAVAEELVDVPTGVDDGGHRNHWNTLFEARVVIGDFKDEHNTRHRHSALGYRTPAEYAAACAHDHYAMACEIN
jgi:hypothetical protein